ncbi:MAG: CopD family protein [Alphaproteobacteria bacterium]|nr:CopD family protein [Alphaproteobacteria bacterium]
MQELIDVFGFLSVLLRGAEITAQSIVAGGVVYLLALVRPLAADIGDQAPKLLWSGRRWICAAALALAAVVAVALAVDGSILVTTVDLSLTDLAGADFFIADSVTIVSALILATSIRHAVDRSPALLWACLALAAASLGAAAMTSHGAARISDRAFLVAVDFLHQSAAAVWIGGIPYFLLSLRRCDGDSTALAAIIPRFSRIAMIAVAALLAAGVAMGFAYIDAWQAVYGTAYGVMLTTKVALFGVLLALGAANNRIGARLERGDTAAPVLRLRRFAEVEIGIGLSVFFAAATLTSVPPAIDLTTDRVTAGEIVERMAPRLPTLASPDHSSLAIPHLQAELDARAARENRPAAPAFVPGAGVPPPRNAADILWSEYNHHWSGVLVLLIGLLGLAEKSGRAAWARHWPLLFTVLAGFLMLRSDPEVWPLGDIGLLDSLRDPEVVQHRIFALLIAAFGLFEWTIRTGRNKSQKAALVFPLVTALGGALLLTHSHAISNVKDQLLIELTHAPLAVLGIIAGWARWLEIRLLPADRKIPGWIWPICFVLIGLLLLDYREA